MNDPIYNVSRPPSEFCANRKDCLFNDYLPTNHDEIKIMKEKYSTSFFSQKDIEQSKYLINTTYQTLKQNNQKKDLHTQPYVSYMKNTSNRIENKYVDRNGTNANLKPQSSFNGRVLNNNISYYNNLKDNSKEIKKVKSQFITEANVSHNNPNMDNTNSNLLNYNFYQRIYSNKQSPNKSPITFLVKPVLYEDSNLNLNNRRDHPRIETSNKVVFSEKKVNDKRMKSGEKKFYAKKMDNVIRKRNNNLKIEINENKRYIENRLIEEKYKNINKSGNFPTYDDHCVSLNYFNNSEIKDIDIFFQNNFFHEIGNKNSKNKNCLNENKKNYENIQNKIGINITFKSQKEKEKKKTDILSKKNINLRTKNIPYKLPNSYLIYQKGFKILFKIINNRLNKFWKSLKNILWRQKSYSYYHFSKAGKIITYNPQKISASINVESPICNTLDNAQNKSKEHISSNKKVLECNTSRNKRKYQTNYQQMKFRQILKENEQLHNINTMVNNDNQKLLRKMKNMKGQNSEIMQSESLKNILYLENKKLKLKLKRLYAKYFVEKKIYANTHLLNKALYIFNKNSILISEKKRKITLLYNLVKNKENCIKQILRKFLYKFYMNTRNIFYKKNISTKMEQKYSIIKEKLVKIIYRKKKDILLTLKKYLDKFYYNAMIQRPNKNIFSITKTSNLFITNNNNFNSDKSLGDIVEKRKRKLKLIIKRITNENKIILKGIIKQWILRTKLINMKIILVKEENIKNKINTIDAILKNKIDNSASIKNKNNNLKQDNLIKGIKKLNDIFKSKSNNNNDNSNIEITIKKEESINNNVVGKEKLIYKIYGEHLKYKYNDDWIIEEKEEEQTEENGESTSIKNASEQIEDNMNIISDSNDIKSNEYNNEREKVYFHKNN